MTLTLRSIKLMFSIFLLLAVQSAISQSVIFVDQNATGDNNGTSWSNAFQRLEDALSNASVNDTIWVASGTYILDTPDRDSTFQVPDSVAVYGGFQGTESTLNQRDWENYPTILSGDIGTVDDSTDNCYHVVEPGNHTRLDGFVVEKGNADHSSEPNRFGGGMFIESGLEAIVIKNCIFRHNFADQGGGIFFTNISDATIDQCQFISNNTSTDGGGIKFQESEIDITNCIFAYNKTVAWGAGLMYWGTNSGSPNITNCTFYGNDAGTGDDSGGAIHGRASGINLNIKNCIFKANLPAPIGLTNSAMAQVNYSAIVQSGYYGGTNTEQKPLINDYGYADFRLNPASPCIDAGDPNDPQDPDGSPVDMGAPHSLEYQAIDAGVTAFISPEPGTINNHPKVKVELTNWGTDNLTSADIDWDINGLDQPAISWTGNLATEEKDTITLDADLQFTAGYNIFTAWTMNPNANSDEYPANDTLSETILLEGFRTIGPDTCDFETINEAITYIETSSPFAINYHFYIVEGAYNEQITIPSISGQTEQDQIYFSSYDRDSASVIITSDSADYTLMLDGADYFNFEHLVITNDSTGSPVRLSSNSEFNSFHHCRFSTTKNPELIDYYNAGSNIGCQFSHNTFINGSYGIRGDLSDGTVISDNNFIGQTRHSLRIAATTGLNISRNVISNAATYDGKAMSLSSLNIGIISNNMINITGGGKSINALYFEYGDSIKIYNNTFHTEAGHLLGASSTLNNIKFDIRNNIFSSSANKAVIVLNDDPSNHSNYNIFNTDAEVFGIWGSNNETANLDEWQAITSQDTNSYVLYPAFVSESDLHVTSYPMDNRGTPIDTINVDIDGDTRDPSTPDIGADEYTSPYPSALSGTFTVGTSKADYTTIQETVEALYARGTDGNVEFNLQPGVYNEKIYLKDKVYRYTPEKWITYKSESGDSSDTWISWNTNPGTDESIHRIDGLDYVAFENLGFDLSEISGNSYWYLFEPINTIDNFRLKNNYFKGSEGNYYHIISAAEGLATLINWSIENNYSNSDAAINITDYNKGTILSGNHFNNKSSPVHFSNFKNISIRNNKMKRLKVTNGIQADVNSNVILNNNQYLGNVVKISNLKADSTFVFANNFIMTHQNNGASLEISEGKGYEIYHNTIIGKSLKIDNSDSTKLKNNLVINPFTEAALKLTNSVTNLESDYNNLHSDDTLLVSYNDTIYKSLAEWQSGSENDLHSLSYSTLFVRDSSYEVLSPGCNNSGTPIAKITKDIQGDDRSLTQPDIGADEYEGCSNPIASGTHTIGSNGDFTSFTEAIETLTSCGIDGDLSLRVSTDTYDEKVVLRNIYSEANNPWIVFESASGNPTDVIWKNKATVDTNYNLRIDNAHNVAFKNISFRALDSVNNRTVDLRNDAENILFESCRFIAPETNQNNTELVYGEVGDSVWFTRNIFEFGEEGLRLSAYEDTTRGIIIDSNQFKLQKYTGIEVTGLFAPKITNNTMISTNSENTAIIYSGSATEQEKGIIANNFITGNYHYGIYAQQTKYLNILYNSIHLYGDNPNINYAVYLYSPNDTPEINVLNNVLKGNNLLIYFNANDPANLTCNYNILFTEGNNLARLNSTEYENLSMWQSGTGFDANSLEIEPQFISNTDLHMQSIPLDNQGTPIPGITEDIDGETRDGSTPDIGADEYTAPGFSIGEDTTLCTGTPITLDAGDGFDSYEWSNDSSTRKITIVSNESGTFNYAVTATLKGTAYSDDINVTFREPQAIAEDADACFGDTVLLEGSGGVDYMWEYDSPVYNQSIEIPINWSGSRNYSLTVWDEMGCSDDTVVTVYSHSIPDQPTIFSDVPGSIYTFSGYESYQWYLDGNLAEEFTEYSISPEEGGNYQVIVSNGYCESPISEEFSFVPQETAIQSEFAHKKINIYPNPVDNYLVIHLDDSFDKFIVEITNILGNVVYSTEQNNLVKGSKLQIPFSSVDSGIYFIQIKNGSSIITRRILKQ